MYTLQNIIDYKKNEVSKEKLKLSTFEINNMIMDKKNKYEPRGFLNALLCNKSKFGIISELKKASPSKGLIRKDFDPIEIAKEYKKCGATCLSVLTDFKFFQGKNAYINDVKKVTNLPIYKRALDFKVSVVPQNGGVFTDMTCYQNLKAIADLVIVEKKERLFKIENMISKFELDAVKFIKAKYLSGGQRKRLSISMALLSNPKIILMDEPFQGLDLISTRSLQETIVNLQTEDNSRCCVISDHAARDLLNISDRAIILANKKIIAHGQPKELIQNEDAKNLYFGNTFNIN